MVAEKGASINSARVRERRFSASFSFIPPSPSMLGYWEIMSMDSKRIPQNAALLVWDRTRRAWPYHVVRHRATRGHRHRQRTHATTMTRYDIMLTWYAFPRLKTAHASCNVCAMLCCTCSPVYVVSVARL
jgi:hypothetical protein